MKKPDWFLLIEQWVPKKMGEIGPTLPFLVGALAKKTGKRVLRLEDVRAVLHEITEHPVDGYVTEVSWCSYLCAPVFNMKEAGSRKRMKSAATIARPTGAGESLVFGPNLLFQWDSKDASALLERLAADAAKPVCEGRYSCKPSKYGSGDAVYGDFSPKEIEYIEGTIMSCQ